MRGLRLVAVVLAIGVLGSCDLIGRPSGVHTGPDGLRTFTVARGSIGSPVLCTLGLAANPLTGTLAGDANDPERVWLVGPGGNRISIVWPEGFHVRFEPIAVLYDERSRPVAQAGQQISFDQVNLEDHAGTPADPYWATGLVFDGCYPPAQAAESR